MCFVQENGKLLKYHHPNILNVIVSRATKSKVNKTKEEKEGKPLKQNTPENKDEVSIANLLWRDGTSQILSFSKKL